MKTEDINEILEYMHKVNPSELSGDARKLFYAIMQIADERDEYMANNIELLTFIRNTKKDKEFSKWRKKR